jgi:NADH dehydrogenase
LNRVTVDSFRYFDKGLARQSNVEVTLINRENYTLFTPMLHEVASGDLYAGDIINPIRRILRHVKFVEAEVDSIDLKTRFVHCTGGSQSIEVDLPFDHLLIALGSETNYFDLPGVADWSATIKSLSDATLLRSRVTARLEEAVLLKDDEDRRRCLTFVTAGGGFAIMSATHWIITRIFPRISCASSWYILTNFCCLNSARN